MRFGSALLFVALAVPALLASPEKAAAFAAADLARLNPAGRTHARYLSLYVVPEADLARWGKVLDFWVNGFSREAELTPLVRVRPDLLRLDLRAYGIDPKVWENLANVEPYFTVRLKAFAPGPRPKGSLPAPRRPATALAPWLDSASAKALALYTRSKVPVVRGDWFLAHTGLQVGRKGTGYFDFLGVKNRADFQALVGLDEKLAVRLRKETRAIVARSGVALNNRQIVRFATITGAYWVTLDANSNDGRRNAVRNLDKDYLHDAEEIYGSLPNGLFGFFAGDRNGVRQDAVPDNIASDSTAPGNDRRIHPVSCVRCHVEGIRPIDDWGRKVYRAPLLLAAADYDQARRLQRTYLSDLKRLVRRDQADYAEVLGKLTGYRPAEAAAAVGRSFADYDQADLDLAGVALASGYPEARVKQVLLAVATLTPPLDPVFAGLIANEPEPVRREHLEEGFAVLMTHLKGYKP